MVSHAYYFTTISDIEPAADVVKPETSTSRGHPLRTWAQRFCEGLKLGNYSL